MNSLHHDYDHSDDEDPTANSGSRKRSSRACDQCRKTKSKCEKSPDSNTQCKSCVLAGTTCTFLGPSYKRGPPKGYIRAIEQRWHQVEALLGAIIQCTDPQVQDMIGTLRADTLSREIIDRVDNGPYGPSGRLQQPNDATKEDFFASIMRSNERSPAPSTSHGSTRSRRQSRISREVVSSAQDNTLSIIPTTQWQDSVSALLSGHTNGHRQGAGLAYNELSGEPASQRRRFNGTWMPGASEQPDYDDLDEPEEDADSTTQFLGHLSLDEHSEMRYHGNASGLHLLSRNGRTDDRIQSGIWHLPMARVWPPSKRTIHAVRDDSIDEVLPPVEIQDHLISLYFTHIHPTFPVINKRRFLLEYNHKKHRNGLGDDMDSPSSNSSASSSTPKPETSQKVSKLLLFSMFAVASRFDEEGTPAPPPGKMWEAGFEYLIHARSILTKVFHLSKASTVQALLLLGHRDFGMGSMEAAWANIGLAIRMAIDLGLNCDAEQWRVNGVELFSRDEVQTRRQIWWACMLADRYGSMYMGRPICIREADFDIPHPEISEEEDAIPWQLLPSDPLSQTYQVSPSRTSSCFNAVTKLIVIMGTIVTEAYPIRKTKKVDRKAIHTKLENSLDQWYIDLPEYLRVDTKSNRPPPPPHVLFLHIRYWGAAQLLHRAFVPNWKKSESMMSFEANAFAMKAFDLAQAAATHLSSIATLWLETFTLTRSTPFLTSYLLNAGIVHIATLKLRSSSPSASLGLQQCLNALKNMSFTWPSASRAYELLDGVDLSFDRTPPFTMRSQPRSKRGASDAFGVSDMTPSPPVGSSPASGHGQGIQDLNQTVMAQMLGLDIPGVLPNPSTSFLPGYSEWWPKHHHPPSVPQTLEREVSLPPPQQQQPQSERGYNGNSSYSVPRNSYGQLSNAYPNAQEDLAWIQHHHDTNTSAAQHPLYYDYDAQNRHNHHGGI